MKIFNDSPKPTKSEKVSTKGTRKKSTVESNNKTVKKDISEASIREKLAAHSEISNTSKSTAIKKTQALGAGFMNEDIKPKFIEQPQKTGEEAQSTEVDRNHPKDHLLNSDVSKNDPNDGVTSEKLKTVLVNGAFNFNPKEREVLSRILAEKN